MKKFFIKNGFRILLLLVSFVIGLHIYSQNNVVPKPKIDISKININFLKQGKSKTTTERVLFKDREYKLSYSSEPVSKIKELAKFEDDERWSGDGEFDYSEYFEGRNSLYLASSKQVESEAILDVKEGIDINNFKSFRMFVELRSEPSSAGDFRLIFADKKSQPIYEYPIKNLSRGWNMLIIPREDFVKHKDKDMVELSKVIFKLVSSPFNSVSVNLDYFWAEKDDRYLDEWNFRNKEFLFLKEWESSLYLAVTNLKGSLATLKKIGSARNFTFKTKFIPLREGFFGLFIRGDLKNGYGYYLVVNGPGGNEWEIFKQGTFRGKFGNFSLKKGKIEKFLMEKNHPYWLKAEAKDNHLFFDISLNGEEYLKMGDAVDESFNSGEVGIISGNYLLLLDDIEFSQ